MNREVDYKCNIIFKNGLNLIFLFFISFNSNYIFAKNSSFIIHQLSFQTTSSIHAFHTSITQIEFNSKSNSYEISLRIFTDDFEKAIDFENKIKGTKIIDGDKNDALVSAYVSKHFSIISPQNKKAVFKYIGKENEELATWIYLELPIANFPKGTKFQQNVLMELFDDQVNILNFRNGELRKSMLFDSKNKVKVWE